MELIKMEIFDVQHPLIMIFGILGNIVSTGVYFAPLPTFIQIWNRKSTMGFQSLPYVVSLFSAFLWLYYALIKQGDTFLLITINALGSFIESIYIIVFIVYATPHAKKQTYKILTASMVLCLAISLGTFFGVKTSIRAEVVGWVCVGISVCVFAAPLTIVFQVVKTKSVEFMPFPLSCFLTLSAMMWFTYGMFTVDLCVTVPNVLGFVLGIIQMALYKYYKRGKSKVPTVQEIKMAEHIINIKISNSDIYPVESSRSGSGSGSEAAEEKKLPEEGGGEIKCGGPVVAVEDQPCGVEVVNAKPMETPVLVMCAA